MTRTTRAVLMFVATTIAACGGGAAYGSGDPTSPPSTDPRTVAATPALTFGPASLTVNAGDAVTFDFGSVPHNVFFDRQTGAPSDIDGNNANVSIKRSFATPGTYRYTCHIHPSMQGTIVVQ
jgi:plastocyanin